MYSLVRVSLKIKQTLQDYYILVKYKRKLYNS